MSKDIYNLKFNMIYDSQEALVERLLKLAYDIRAGIDVNTNRAGGGGGSYSFSEDIKLTYPAEPPLTPKELRAIRDLIK